VKTEVIYNTMYPAERKSLAVFLNLWWHWHIWRISADIYEKKTMLAVSL